MAGSSTGFPLSTSISSPRSDDGLGLSVTGLVVSLDQIGSDRGFLGWRSYTEASRSRARSGVREFKMGVCFVHLNIFGSLHF